ncbi:type VI secretion system Vgr family protein [Paucibacter sp. hw1]|uniref:Type VI secretion system Vgr family protein n=1 Tax=Roseateles koreensis TaxID=2987526 RepID=A0ABT5KMF7_9BURK|nr:type VI secretion system Vgr family protein [Roseateles koreensis]
MLLIQLSDTEGLMPNAPLAWPDSHIQHRLHIVGMPQREELDLIGVQGRERLGGLYRHELACEAPAGVDVSTLIKQLIGCRAQLTLGSRGIWGQISAAHWHYARGVPRLNLVLEPRLALLGVMRANQVFLNQSSVQTVQAVLEQSGLSAQWQDWQTTAQYPVFAQRTMFEQTALDFVLWLLAYEGIGLRFEHAREGERLVFFDDHAGLDRSSPYLQGLRVAPRAGLVNDSEPETLTHASLQSRATAQAVDLTEYDAQQAQLNLSVTQGEAQDGEQVFHSHGEHYKTVVDGDQIAQVRLQERLCRQQTLQGQGPLMELQAGRVIKVDGDDVAGYWLVTELHLDTHRDGSLHTRFEAARADNPQQMWRPERVTPRPKVHGLVPAKIHRGQPIAQLDEVGRYHVGYPWQDQPESKALRMVQPYAGPSYGSHFPLKDNAEVWLGHVQGDPDRPIVLGVSHSGQQADVVTAKDNSRNVLRSQAGNKLRLEDRQGEEHIKLYTPHGHTQLNLGHMVTHGKKQRGQGLELRSALHGAIRSANQLLITTGTASPRATGEAQRSASSSEVRATLQNLHSFIGNRSLAAHQVGAFTLASLPTATGVKNALDTTVKDALGPSKPHQIHWAAAGQVLGAPTLHAAASQDLGLWSIAGQDWLAGSQIQLATQGASRVHIEQGGRKAFVSEGNSETTVSKGRLHILVEGNITLQSQGGAISLKAGGSSIQLTAHGHAGLKSSGASVMQTSLHEIKAGAVMVQGGSTAQVPGALAAMPFLPNGYSKRFQLKDAKTGQWAANAKYWLTANGKTTEAYTDEQGCTHTAFTYGPQAITIEVEDGGLELHA